MAGIPVIASWCGGASEIVEHDETGWLAKFPEDTRTGNYEEASPEGLAEAMVRLAFDRDKRVGMGTAAGKQARELFSTSVVAAAFDRLYGEVAAGDDGR
jgi:glycosyltransferase involved in cell wall biosynthesis